MKKNTISGGIGKYKTSPTAKIAVSHRRRRFSCSVIFTLHRYYVWAIRIESRLYMSYWYGGLYVVIEGWKQLGLSDLKIDLLLKSKNVRLLRQYRNGVFHFQRNYDDKRFLGFITKGENCVDWIRQLNSEFGRFFLEWFNAQKCAEPD